MKQLFFTFVLLLLPTLVLAQTSSQQEVEMTGRKSNGHSRSGLVLPVVIYSSDQNTLNIEYFSEDSYELKVQDVYGLTWFSGPLDTSGVLTEYYVNLQSNNTYFITISSANYSFYGILEL
ncbi:MAG: hypothetical protein IJV11_12360 [Muribaculaceae bacterium]|nr:hypothetical protein [Muribaculaceae bacterium]